MQVETYFIQAGQFVPNNRVPALVYRDVLPKPLNRDSAKVLCEKNHWQKRGEWGAIYNAHFHPNTHECYAILAGESKLALGRERHEDSKSGVEIDVKAGDVIVVPAGVSHRSLTATDDYRYIGVYPEACPKWRNDYCRGEEDMDALKEEIDAVGVPYHDPVYGLHGPLFQIWSKASVTRESNL